VDQFPGNSLKAAEGTDEPAKDEKKVEKVVVGEVIRRKPPLGKRFAAAFFGGTAKSVVEYVLLDVLIPAGRDLIVEIGTSTVERAVYGDDRRAPGRNRFSRRTETSTGYVPYNRFGSGTRGPDPRDREISRRARATHDFDEIILASRPEAEEVIEKLNLVIDKYRVASLADLYHMVGVSDTPQDNKWGWTEALHSRDIIVRTRGGYLLDLPKPEPLD